MCAGASGSTTLEAVAPVDMGTKWSLEVGMRNTDRVHLGRRSRFLPVADPCMPPTVGCWQSPWARPAGGYGFWTSIWADITKTVSTALGRWANVVLVCEEDLAGSKQVRLHAPCTTLETTERERVIEGDVVVIHDRVDVLLLSCSQATDLALRSALANAGYPAAARVCLDAEEIQRGGDVLDWITTMNQECNNPAALGHKSAGVTVDWGLHDSQLSSSVMLSTELGVGCSFPPSTHTIRTATYERHRAACLATLSGREQKHFARKRLSSTGGGQCADHVMLPSMRLNSLPKADDATARAATTFEGLCRSAASDISNRFFAALPGVRALNDVQSALKWGVETWKDTLFSSRTCPFEGGTDYLYTKGSISQQGTKSWHDDANGPACLTCWQNLGVVQNEQLELVVAVNGCRIVIEAQVGKTTLFMGWLPHRTQMRSSDGCTHDMKEARRLHHTAYVKFGTEYAAITLDQYRRRRLPLNGYTTR